MANSSQKKGGKSSDNDPIPHASFQLYYHLLLWLLAKICTTASLAIVAHGIINWKVAESTKSAGYKATRLFVLSIISKRWRSNFDCSISVCMLLSFSDNPSTYRAKNLAVRSERPLEYAVRPLITSIGNRNKLHSILLAQHCIRHTINYNDCRKKGNK